MATKASTADTTGHSTLLMGGLVYPNDPQAEGTLEAMLIVDGRIAWVGSDDDALAWADSTDERVQLEGALVTPAFVDPHVHSTSTGLLLTGLDLTDCTSLPEALERIESFCRTTGSAGVVLGHGWDETRWPEARPPTRQEVDRASYGAMLYLSRIDVHSALVSSALLAVLPDLAGYDGFDPSGLLTREAHHRARAIALDSVSASSRAAAQRATRRHCAQRGVAAIHEIGGPEISSPDDFTGMLSLAAEEPGPEVVGYWGQIGGAAEAAALGALGAAGDLFVDGSIGSHTASLRSEYADAPTCGAAYLSVDQIRDHVVTCTQLGMQSGFHSIGDAAMDAVVAGYEEAAAVVGVEAIRAARHRIEHAEMVDQDLMTRMGYLGLYASVQPAFDPLWGGTEGMYAERLGPDRAVTLNPLADLLAAGVVVALGSDSPVTPVDPWGGVRAAMSHHVPSQRLSFAVAFDAHTRGGWRAARDDESGRLSVGSPATYAIWDVPRLPALVDGGKPPACLRTVLRGQTIFTSEKGLAT